MKHRDKKQEEVIEVYVRFTRRRYVLTSQPARIVSGTVTSRSFVEGKIVEAFKSHCYGTRRLGTGTLEVSTRRSLDNTADRVLRIINENAKASPDKPVRLNQLHYSA